MEGQEGAREESAGTLASVLEAISRRAVLSWVMVAIWSMWLLLSRVWASSICRGANQTSWGEPAPPKGMGGGTGSLPHLASSLFPLRE